MKRRTRFYWVITVIVLLGIVSGIVYYSARLSPNTATTPTLIPRYIALLAKAKQNGSIQIIAQFSVPFMNSTKLFADGFAKQRLIEVTRQGILNDMSGYNVMAVFSDYDWPIPVIAMELDEPALCHLLANPLIVDVEENVSLPMSSIIHVTQAATPD